MNIKYVRMTIFVNIFIESATKKGYGSDIKCHRTLNILYVVYLLNITIQGVRESPALKVLMKENLRRQG
jgi:hypothetical protein